MTEQYLIGELSRLIGDFELGSDALVEGALSELRKCVERASFGELPALAREAATLAEMLCMGALERCDACQFSVYLGRAAALEEFVVTAGLAA